MILGKVVKWWRGCTTCWTYAIKRWYAEGPKQTWIAIQMSRYIPGIPHMIFIRKLNNAEVEEARPKGSKQHGLKGVKHALTSEWEVRNKVDED